MTTPPGGLGETSVLSMELPAGIVVVGNGPSLLEVPLGGRIDAFEQVVRFNKYRTRGYEECSGVRCTIWVRNDLMRDRDSERSLGQYQRILLYRPQWKVRKRYPPVRSACPYEVIPADCEEEVRRRACLPARIWPAAGPVALAYLCRSYPLVWIAGFDCFAEGRPHHYFPGRDHSSVHTEEYDRRFLDSLETEGRIRWLKP